MGFFDSALDFATSEGGANLIGSIGSALISSNAASDAANANLKAAQMASAASEFKPYSITTGFGTSFFDKDKQQAGYELDPVLKAFRDQYYGGAANFIDQLETDPTKAAAKYMAEQQALQQPGRLAEDIALRNQQLQRGRIGLGLSGEAVGAGTGTGYVNPEQYQRDLARAMADQQLAAQSRELAQADIDRLIGRGTGLLQTGLGIEEQGLRPLTIGADIGSKQAVSQNQQAQALLAGGQQAATANLAGSLGLAQAAQNAAKAFGGLFTGTPTAAVAQTPVTYGGTFTANYGLR